LRNRVLVAKDYERETTQIIDYEEDAVEDLDLVDKAYKEDLKLAIHETRNKNYACYEAVT